MMLCTLINLKNLKKLKQNLGFGLGFIPNFWGVSSMGFGCGYETHIQNPNLDYFGCECMIRRDKQGKADRFI